MAQLLPSDREQGRRTVVNGWGGLVRSLTSRVLGDSLELWAFMP